LLQKIGAVLTAVWGGRRKSALILMLPLLMAVPATVHAESALDKLKAAAKKLQLRNLSGDYTYTVTGYGERGVAKVEQQGNQIRILLTWTPVGQATHYEVKGKLVGNTIEGQWYSHYARKGWYKFHGKVSASGDSIDFSRSDDPIRSNMNKTVMQKKSNPPAASKPAVVPAPQQQAQQKETPPPQPQPQQAPRQNLANAQTSSEPPPPSADYGTPEGTAKIAAKAGFLDVVGVKLGMPVKDALKALKAHNGNLQMEPITMPAYEALPGVVMTPVFATLRNTAKTADEAIEYVSFLTTFAPNEAFVWGVTRHVAFGTEASRPTVENTLAGLRKKYGPESTRYADTRLIWVYDTQGQQVMGPRAKDIYEKCGGHWIVGGGIVAHTQAIGYINLEVVKGYYGTSTQTRYYGGICQSHSLVDVTYVGAIQRGSTAMLVMEIKTNVTNRQLEASGVTAAHTLLTREATKIAERRREESSKVGGPKF
jgi:hypothetical protein